MSPLLSRRRAIQFATLGCVLPVLPRRVQAQSYPARPVRLVVGYAPGGATDIVARLVGQSLSMRLGQQFIVENRPGAGTNIATQDVIRSPADGYSLLLATAANAINATLYEKPGFDFVRDTEAVAGLVEMQNVLEIHPALPVRTIAELIAYAKDHPDQLALGSPGIGSPGHVSGELFKMMTGVRMLHVPYRGIAPALTDLVSGQIQVLVDNMATAIEHIRAGAVRALGITTAKRSKLLPDLPTIGEAVPGYDASSWYGIAAPKGTPPGIIALLNREINATLADAVIVRRFDALGATPLQISPEQFDRFMADETEKWGRVVRFAGVKEP